MNVWHALAWSFTVLYMTVGLVALISQLRDKRRTRIVELLLPPKRDDW